MIKFIINAILWLATAVALIYSTWYYNKEDQATTHIFMTELEQEEALIEYQNDDIHVFESGFDSELGEYPYYLTYNTTVTNSFVQKLNIVVILGVIQPIRWIMAIVVFIINKDSNSIKKLFLTNEED